MRFIKLLFILALAAAGCQNTPSTIHLSGTFEEFEEGEKLFLYRSADRIGYREWLAALDTTTLNARGEFQFSYTTSETEFYQVAGEGGFPKLHDVFLEPGDSLHINVPVRSDTTRISYHGINADMYEIHNLFDSLWRNDSAFQKNYYDISLMDIDSASEFLRHRYEHRLSVSRSFFEGRPEWDELEGVIAENVYYRATKDFYDYLYYHNYYSNDTFTYLIPDDSYYEFVDTIDLDTPPEFYSYEYMFFLSAFLRDHFNRDYENMDDSIRQTDRFPLMLETAKRHLNGEALDLAFLAIAGEFAFYLSGDNFFEVLDSMDSFLAVNHNSNSNYAKFQFIKSKYDNLRPGSQAPDIALPDVNGDTVRLSDYPGKVLYVDFWGTWCFPCLQELPHSLELQEEFTDKPVEFIYVGLQSGEDQLRTWKEFVLGESSLSYAPFLEQRVYPGIHLLSEGQFNNPALKPYMLRAAPTYVLIDSKGKIISANAPRPSSNEIVELLNDALVEI